MRVGGANLDHVHRAEHWAAHVFGLMPHSASTAAWPPAIAPPRLLIAGKTKGAAPSRFSSATTVPTYQGAVGDATAAAPTAMRAPCQSREPSAIRASIVAHSLATSAQGRTRHRLADAGRGEENDVIANPLGPAK